MKTRHERWLVGAGNYNIKQQQLRIDEYQAAPDKCLFCKQNMPYIPPRQRLKRKFCNKSCAAKQNNQIRLTTQTVYNKGITKQTQCVVCNTDIVIGKNANAKAAKCLKCKHNSKQSLLTKNCRCCNQLFQYYKHSRRLCCSPICFTTLRKQGASKGGRISASRAVKRSKDEIALYELCKSYFTSVRHNEIIIDGWDADIIIDDYKIAIMWNGQWHYKQLTFKNHSLLQVQTRDKIKFDVLTSAGWDVIIFNDEIYTPEQAFNTIKENFRGGI